jgi:hypothetical protein
MPASSAVQIFGEKHLNGAKIFLNEVSKITKKSSVYYYVESGCLKRIGTPDGLNNQTEHVVDA